MTDPSVAAVVVHFNQPDRTRRCVESLRLQDAPVHVVLVDHSPDGDAPRFAAGPLHQTLRGANRGFGAGVNLGWRETHADTLLLLNPDAVAEPSWAAAMITTLHQGPRVGMAAVRVQRSGARGELDSAGLALTAGGMGFLRGHGLPVDAPPQELATQPLLGPTGAAAAYRRELLEDLGGFPEDYFLYYEDLEVALRARRRGWECGWVDDPLVTHEHDSGAGAAKPYHMARAHRLFRLRNLGEGFPRRHGAGAIETAAARTRAVLRGRLGELRRGIRDAESHHAAHPTRFESEGPVDPAWLAGSVRSMLRRRNRRP